VVAINAGISTITPRRKGKDKDRKKDEAEREKKAEPAGTEVDILGGYSTPEEAALLAGVLNSGVLPFPLTVRSQRVVPVE
jgi:preprotein translocase subunit SecD